MGWVLLTLAVGVFAGGRAVGLISAILMGAALGVWRLVRIQAKLLEYRQAEFYADDDV